MPKRKSDCLPQNPVSISSLDAALDLLACETFTRLSGLTTKFEAAAGVKLNDGVIKTRWEEAVRRYWVMKSMDDLCCGMSKATSSEVKAKEEINGDEVNMDGDTEGNAAGPSSRRDSGGRALPSHVHPGAPVIHGLNAEEEAEWKRWTPKVGEAVLVELSDDSIWPGKIIDKKVFFQGRNQPRGNHFWCIRIYSEDMSPTVTVKSRLVPLHMRPNPPLLASTPVLSAFNHANNPSSFDMRASARESLEARQRAHPGVNGSDKDMAKIKAEKASWNELINWVLTERRVEKLRALEEERRRQLESVTKTEDVLEALGENQRDEDACPKKRRTTGTVPLPPCDSPGGSQRSASPGSSIFGAVANGSNITPRRTASPSLPGYIRPSLATPQRPASPRRFADKRRSTSYYSGMGERSPRGRGGTYTPPRILPSGDETAPYGGISNGSPAPSLQSFDFVSPLGPVKLGRLESSSALITLQRKGSLEVVKEEPKEDEAEGWTVVQKKRGRRAGSAPCRDKAKEMENGQPTEEMTLDGE